MSSKGNTLIFVFYHQPTNDILDHPIPSRQGQHIVTAFEAIHQYLLDRNHTIECHMVDNETPPQILQYFKKHNNTYQCVIPHNHRANTAECEIQTFKHHFISILYSLPDDFPLYLWCRLLPQFLINLNKLRTSNIDQHLYAYASLEGPYDFNSHPMAPPGSPVMVPVKPNQRATWSPHAVKGLYLGPALTHYLCYKVFIPSTNSERISNTIEFIHNHHTCPMPLKHSLLTAAHTITDTVHAQPQTTTDLSTLTHLENVLKSTANSLTTSEQRVPPHNQPTESTSPVPSTPFPLPSPRIQPARNAKLPINYAAAVICPTSRKALEYRQLLQTPAKTTW